MSAARLLRFTAVLLALVLVCSGVLAQDETEPIEETPAVAAGTEAPPLQTSQLYSEMEWVLNDMMRCIEELRNAEDLQSKRLLVEQVEELLYRQVEFPFMYQQSDSPNALDVAPIGATTDVVDGREANPLAPLFAQAFALMGIAKGYEGYAAAANDYIDRAKEIYGNVLSMRVRIDSFQVPKELNHWLADSRGRWGATSSIRVTFYGKTISQEVVDGLNLKTLHIKPEDAGNASPAMDYNMLVAQHDFLKGMRRYVVTDDLDTKRRDNKFFLYLPPGKYRLMTEVSMDYGTIIEVHANPSRNHYMVETIEDGVTVYPVPDAESIEESVVPTGYRPLEPAETGSEQGQ